MKTETVVARESQHTPLMKTRFYEAHKGDCPQCANPNTTHRSTLSNGQPLLWCADCSLAFEIEHAILCAADRENLSVMRTDKADGKESIISYKTAITRITGHYRDGDSAKFSLLQGQELNTPFAYYVFVDNLVTAREEAKKTGETSEALIVRQMEKIGELTKQKKALVEALQALIPLVRIADKNLKGFAFTSIRHTGKAVSENLAQAEQALRLASGKEGK